MAIYLSTQGQHIDLVANANQPAASPPPWAHVNFENPTRRGQDTVIVGGTLCGIMVFTVACRAYAKLCVSRNAHWDDRRRPLIPRASLPCPHADDASSGHPDRDGASEPPA